MSTNRAEIDAPVPAVWSVLADPRQYARFVVGSKRIRWFEPDWPDVGSAIHHRVGVGPLFLQDESRVTEVVTGRLLRLSAGLRPVAVTEIVFSLEPAGDDRTSVCIEEWVLEGPATVFYAPLVDRLMWLRNAELLRRLEKVAAHRAETMAASGPLAPAGTTSGEG